MSSLTFAVVVTYRAPEKLAVCLASLEGEAHPTAILVCDNSEDNIYYTAAINEGIRTALERDYDYVLICCDDVTVHAGCVKALSDYLDENPKCAIAAPVQLSKAGAVTCAGCREAFPYGVHITGPDSLLTGEPYESYWANGACFLLRAAAARECGLLDENMRFICSDADYSLTLRSRGWSVFVVPPAKVTHEPDGALHRKNDTLTRIKLQDTQYFMQKWILGGLFKRYSFEGEKLTPQQIVACYEQTQAGLAQLPEE